MKKFSTIFSLIFMLVIGFSFMSCSHEIEPYDYAKAQRTEFKQSFEKTFGTIAADQDWGFNNIEVFNYTESSAKTRGHDVNRNEWSSKYVIPNNVTSEEEQAVLNELATGNYSDAKPTFDWKFYFVYQVHRGTDSYNDHNGSNIGVASSYMNHLQAVYSDGSMEHINDFNSGDQKVVWQSIQGATVMVNSTTYDFAYHNSRDSKYHNCYTVIDGTKIGYPGFYYICFDFLANGDIEQPANKNMGVDRNNNYTDWIIRISPCEFNMNGAVRIIAEDLGSDNGSDFDYNDVVFDVKLFNEYTEEFNYQGKLIGYFVLQAAGGTLPLSVAGEEVHRLFGVESNVMINTGAGPSKNPVQFRVVLGNADHNTPGATLVKNIPVVVQYKNNSVIELATETGEAPEKIAVKPTTRWCKEYKQHAIYLGYPDFPRWVQDKTVNWQDNFVVEHLY